MKKLFNLVLAILLTVAISGCSLLGGPIAEKVAGVIDDYCTEPLSARELYRDTVNQELAAEGHSIEVRCAGDPDEVTRAAPQVSPRPDPGEDLVAAVLEHCAAPGDLLSTTNHRVAVRCRSSGAGG